MLISEHTPILTDEHTPKLTDEHTPILTCEHTPYSLMLGQIKYQSFSKLALPT